MRYVKFLRIETKDGIELDIPFDLIRIGQCIITVTWRGMTVAEFYGGKRKFKNRIYSPEKEMCLVYFDVKED